MDVDNDPEVPQPEVPSAQPPGPNPPEQRVENTVDTSAGLSHEAYQEAPQPARQSVSQEASGGASGEVLPATPANLPDVKAEVKPTLRLHEKHRLAIRWMHWLNFPLLAVMIWSGILIYWADSGPNGQHSSQVYRVGLGHWTLFRFFPLPFYDRFHLTFNLALGMGYHYFFMWLFAINGIAYVLYTWISGEWRSLLPGRDALKSAWGTVLYDLHLRRQKPPQGKYNGAQQIAYTAVVLMGLGSLLTGLAIYKPTQLHLLTTLLGGYESARFLHFWLTMGFVVFFMVHVVQVALAGWNNFRSMIAGYEVVRVEERAQPKAPMGAEVRP
jgi:thiosulfate reductase cytochrome b subunit